MIRKASLEDLNLVSSMAIKFMEESPYRKYSEEFVVNNLSFLYLNDPSRYVVFVDDSRGFIAGCIAPFVFGTGLVAYEQAFWVEATERGQQTGRDLLIAFEDWARETGCFLVTMISLDDRVGKYYEKNGYSLAERTYIKEL